MAITMQCNATDAGAKPMTVHGNQIYVRTTHQGLVLKTYERNGYDDSDFIAAVWNPETNSIDHICYATTRGWSYGNYADADAAPEIVAAARQYLNKKEAAAREMWNALNGQIPNIGSTVRVDVSKGKNVRFNGRHGRIFWIGAGYKPGSQRAGVEIDGERVFFEDRNLWAILPTGERAGHRWDEALVAISIRRRVDSTGMYFAL